MSQVARHQTGLHEIDLHGIDLHGIDLQQTGAAKALFLDRDGVINREVGYLHEIQAVEFIEGVFAACRQFQQWHYRLFMVTNQAGIARNYYTEADFHHLTSWMLEQFQAEGIEFSQVYYSPFHPEQGVGHYRQDTDCRKPKPGMIRQAQAEFNLDLSQSILVGDKETDIAAGIAAGIPVNVLVRSGHAIAPGSTQASAIINSIQDLPALAIELAIEMDLRATA
jgi:D-glycero-D-manno-heptose 1,7-bisphosphate phosphatase